MLELPRVLAEVLESDDGVTCLVSKIISVAPFLGSGPVISVATDYDGPSLAQEVIEEHFGVEGLHGCFDRAANRVKFSYQGCFE